MHFEVIFLGDDELPERHDWAMVWREGHPWLFVKESRVTTQLLELAQRGAVLLANERLEREHRLSPAV